MNERHPRARYAVHWPVRLWVGDRCVVAAQALDARAYAIRVRLINWLPSDFFAVGQRCRIGGKPWDEEEIVHVAEVRMISPRHLDLETTNPLPVERPGAAPVGLT